MPSPVRNHLCLIRLIPEANLALKPSSDLRLHEVSLALECQEDTRHITYPSANASYRQSHDLLAR